MSEELGESIKHTLQFLLRNLPVYIALRKLIDYSSSTLLLPISIKFNCALKFAFLSKSTSTVHTESLKNLYVFLRHCLGILQKILIKCSKTKRKQKIQFHAQ